MFAPSVLGDFGQTELLLNSVYNVERVNDSDLTVLVIKFKNKCNFFF